MGRNVVIEIWCDACDAESDDTRREADAGSVVVAIDNATPRQLDLCGPHKLALIEPLAGLLESHGTRDIGPSKPGKVAPAGRPLGRPSKAATANARPVTEFVTGAEGAGLAYTCPLCDRPFLRIGSHLDSAHGLNVASTLGRDGLYHCPLCPVTRDNSMAMGQHVPTEHGTLVAIALALADVHAQADA